MEEPVGSIRNSHRETNPIRKKYAPKRIAEQARELVDGCSKFGPIIRQRLDIERMKQPLQKGVFYVIENDGNTDPGFLVFLPGQAPVFLQTKTKSDPPCTLRMRVSSTLGEGGGSILIASLDRVQHTLRIEDVWMWKGNRVFDTTVYSKRRVFLKDFVERHWIPDTRLMGGVITSVLNPRSLQDFLEKPQTPVNTVELIPEMPGKRRMWFANDFQPSVQQASKIIPVTTKHTRAIAKAVDKMPDIYELYDISGTTIGCGSVQKFSLSQSLRTRNTSAGVPVQIRWIEEFNGYEIVDF